MKKFFSVIATVAVFAILVAALITFSAGCMCPYGPGPGPGPATATGPGFLARTRRVRRRPR